MNDLLIRWGFTGQVKRVTRVGWRNNPGYDGPPPWTTYLWVTPLDPAWRPPPNPLRTCDLDGDASLYRGGILVLNDSWTAVCPHLRTPLQGCTQDACDHAVAPMTRAERLKRVEHYFDAWWHVRDGDRFFLDPLGDLWSCSPRAPHHLIHLIAGGERVPAEGTAVPRGLAHELFGPFTETFPPARCRFCHFVDGRGHDTWCDGLGTPIRGWSNT